MHINLAQIRKRVNFIWSSSNNLCENRSWYRHSFFQRTPWYFTVNASTVADASRFSLVTVSDSQHIFCVEVLCFSIRCRCVRLTDRDLQRIPGLGSLFFKACQASHHFIECSRKILRAHIITGEKLGGKQQAYSCSFLHHKLLLVYVYDILKTLIYLQE